MKKEQLIKKIGDVVMKNSKKGILTTTKFVGTYEYKCGYDSYFAVSLNMDKVLIVYSYFQNDRGEHLDTPTYKLADLPEKELQEIYDNLNTDDKDVLGYVGWTETEEKNLAILVELGLFKPKKTKEYKPIDINTVPDLENPDDAYCIDRDENVRILKCIGKTIFGNPIFDVEKNWEGKYEQPYHTDKPDTFCEQRKTVKNKGIFIAADGYDISEDKYLFVPNKEALATLLKKQAAYKEHYFINTMLESWKRVSSEKPKKETGRFHFTDKEKAIIKFNELRDDLLKQMKDTKAILEDKVKEVNELTKGLKLLDYDDCRILPEDAVVGQEYYVESGNYPKREYIGPFKVVKVDKEREFITLENGSLIYGFTRIITPENLEAYNISCKNGKLMDYLDDLKKAMRYLNDAIDFAEKVKPFTNYDSCVPGWILKDAQELAKKKIPALVTVGA